MKTFRRGVRRAVLTFIPKFFNTIVILGLVFQPVGSVGIWNVALAQSVDPTVSVVEETAPAVDPVEEVTPVVEEEVVAPVEVENPEFVEGNDPAVEDITPIVVTEPEVVPSVAEEITIDTPTDVSASTETIVPAEESTPVEDMSGQICLSDGADVKTSSADDWTVNEDQDKAETKEKVQLGVEYAFPLDKDVKVTFTCLPKDESKRAPLKIGRINTDDIDLPDGTEAASEYAYDITTKGMDNGDFKYDLSLPKSEVDGAEVKYIEQSAEEVVANNVIESELKAVDEDDVKQSADSVIVSDLDHFTTFITTVTTYADALFSVAESEYAPGETIYVKGEGLNDEKYYRIALDPPSGNRIYLNTCFNPASGVTTLTDSHSLSLDAVSGSWAAELREYATSNCTGTHTDVSDDFTVIAPPYTPTQICHATSSQNNPYNLETPNTSGQLAGHVGIGHQNGEDIIPPVSFYLPAGQNWDAAGQAVWNNDCATTGGLKAVKVVDDQSDLTQWSFQLDGDGPIVQADASGVADFGQVTPGQHTLTEIGLASYSVTNVTGTGCAQVGETLGATAEVATGNPTVCTFSNAVDKGSITIVKNAEPTSEQDFIFTTTGDGLATFSLDDDGDNSNTLSNTQTFSGLFPGAYTVTEGDAAGWNLASIACTGNDRSFESDSSAIAFDLSTGENVTCTFTNTRLGTVNVTKYLDADADGVFDEGEATLPEWEIILGEATQTTGEDGEVTFGNVLPGEYPLSETLREGWVQSGISCFYGENNAGMIEDDEYFVYVNAGETVDCFIGNYQTGRIIVEKDVVPDGDATFDFSITGDLIKSIGFALGDGGVSDSYVLPAATYAVTEEPDPLYITSVECVSSQEDEESADFLSLDPGETITCTFTNTKNPPVHIAASKVICANESDLPNRHNGAGITSTTAADYVASHPSCRLEPNWSFQWGYDGVSNPGDEYVGEAGSGWTTFGSTVDISNPTGERLKFREVLPAGYIPFTYTTNGNTNVDDVTAEFYCGDDVVNYDNEEWLNTPQNGETYHCVAWNVAKQGKIIIKKQTDPAGSEQGFVFNPSWSQDNFSLTDGEQYESGDLIPGTYSVTELPLTGWRLDDVICDDQSSPDAISLQSDETVTCTFKNQETAHIVATKIVCTDEADLPNFGLGGPDMTATTAVDWVETHESCSFKADWQFQWAYESDPNPGDNTGESLDPVWHTFGPTGANGQTSTDVDLKSSPRVWMREVWDDRYTPFTFGNNPEDVNGNNVSAEFYCHNDVQNYDNYDFIDASENTANYYCVGWNVPEKGRIIVDKVTDPSEDPQSFHFNTTGTGYSSFDLTDELAPNEQVLAAGTYSVSEEAVGGWDQTSVTCVSSNQEDEESADFLSLDPGETITCTFTNTKNPPVHIAASKVICANESDLPNRHNGAGITSTTAADYVASHPSCRLEPNWSFQWGYDGVSNPGDEYVGEAGSGWTTFGSTVDISNPTGERLKFREVLPAGYIPFTYTTNGNTNVDDVTAEFYCGDDVVNYDNEEWLNTPQNGETYHCVAWNVARGTIHGFKWDDQNGNGSYDCQSDESLLSRRISRLIDAPQVCEPKLPDWTIFIDENGNEAFDEGEQSMDTSDGDEHFGWYWFENLPAGEYSICEVPQAGWSQTYPVNYDEEDETPTPVCHTVTLPDGNSNGFEETQNATFGPEYNFGNRFAEPSLSIEKFNDSVGDEQPGNSVLYTLRVTANDNDVLGVTVTDLPPAGFTYEPGSGTGAPFLHEYASPGVWNVGDMTAGQTVTLTYRATISGSQDDGLYKDLAYATGTSESGGTVVANDPADSDNFVGTQVMVATAETPATVVIPEDNENKIKEKTVKKTKYVLGAATTLPMTGANTDTILLALLMLLSGLILLLLSKQRTWMLMYSLRKSLLKVFFFAVLAGSFLISGQTVSAAANLSVQIETPETLVQSPDFQIGFVALDILGRAVTVECFKNSDTLPFASYPLAAGGSSGNCQVNASVMPVDGDYAFYVKAIASGEGSETVESNHVNVKLVSTVPGTPYNYDRSDASCMNNITFTTAADAGKTVKVELYRSLSTSFAADASTFVVEQAIGSDVAGAFSVAAPGCSNDYFYALRAVNASGFGSGFVGDKDVNVDTHTVTKTKTTIVETPGAAATGAIAVTGTGAGAEAGQVEGAETTNEETVLEGEPVGGSGSVLGEMTEAAGDAAGGFADWIASHPWWSALIALIALALGYYGYETYQRKHNEPLQ